MYIDELHSSTWLMDEFRAEKLNLFSTGEPKTENEWWAMSETPTTNVLWYQ